MKSTYLYKSGVIVHGLSSLYTVVTVFPILLRIPAAQATVEGIPEVVIVLAGFLGVIGLVSTFGAWYRQPWGVWLTIMAEALNGLLALPGVLFAPTLPLRISAITGIVISLFVIFALLYRPRPKMRHLEED